MGIFVYRQWTNMSLTLWFRATSSNCMTFSSCCVKRLHQSVSSTYIWNKFPESALCTAKYQRDTQHHRSGSKTKSFIKEFRKTIGPSFCGCPVTCSSSSNSSLWLLVLATLLPAVFQTDPLSKLTVFVLFFSDAILMNVSLSAKLTDKETQLKHF